MKTTEFDKGIDDVKTKGKEAEKSFNTLKNAIEIVKPETQALRNKLKLLTDQYTSQKENVEKLTKEFNDHAKAEDKTSEETIKLSKALDEAKAALANTETEIKKTKEAMGYLSKETPKATNEMNKLVKSIGTGLKNAAEVGFKAVVAGTAAATAGVAALTKKSVEAYGNYEQLTGGIAKLFGTAGRSMEQYIAENTTADSTAEEIEKIKRRYKELDGAQSTVMANAKKAYKTVGMSQNEYMQSIMGFSAALKNSLGGDSQKAAEMADKAMKSIADNANTFGKYTVSEISDVYTALAKGNYQTLDNLMLGYKGTKEGLQDLIADANALKIANGEAGELSVDSFSDIVEAIDLVQQKMNVAGTTRKEAASTIEGSGNSVKAAWENVLLGFADPEQDIKSLIDDLVNAAITYLGNILPRVGEAFAGIGEAISYAAPVLIEKIPETFGEVLPTLLDTAFLLVTTLGGAILENAPTLIENGMQLLADLINSMIDKIPDFVSWVTETFVSIIGAIWKNLPGVIGAVLGFIGQMVGSLMQEFIDFGADVITWLWDGLKEKFEELKEKAVTWGSDLIQGFLDGINSMKQKVADTVNGIAEKVKGFLHFSRPDEGPLREYEKWMPDFMAGLAKGIKENSHLVTDEIAELAKEMNIGGEIDVTGKATPKTSAETAGKRTGAVSVVQNIYAQAQTASDLMEAALYQQKKAVMLGV